MGDLGDFRAGEAGPRIAVNFERERRPVLSAERERKCLRPFDALTGLEGERGGAGLRWKLGGGRTLPLLVYRGMVAESGVSGKCTNTEVYPTAVKSGLKSLTEGVMTCLEAVVGVSWKLRNDADAGPALTEGRLEIMDAEPWDERRVLEIDERRRGEYGAGEPGWTAATQAAMAEVVAERRLGYEGEQGGRTGGEGRGCVGRFFCGGGYARNG